MFHRASIKLAGLYLVVMMVISVFFSANLYQLSVQELDRGLRRPDLMNGRITIIRGQPISREELIQEQEQEYQLARQRILNRLLLVNAIILVGGGILCYYLAMRTLKPIEEAHEAQNRFTADASHELRTPLTVMQAENEVALMNPKLTLPQAKSQLRSNLEELAKLTSLTEGLLRLAQVEKHTVNKEPVSVLTIVDNALKRIQPQADQKHIRIKNQMQVDATITGDEFGLTEALVILLDNAIKYSPEASEVIIGAAESAKDVSITITDQGVGIKAVELPHIFDRFYRADAARSKQEAAGYGIGLAIAKNVIDQHNGKIEVVSKPGKGSTFTLILPKE